MERPEISDWEMTEEERRAAKTALFDYMAGLLIEEPFEELGSEDEGP